MLELSEAAAAVWAAEEEVEAVEAVEAAAVAAGVLPRPHRLWRRPPLAWAPARPIQEAASAASPLLISEDRDP